MDRMSTSPFMLPGKLSITTPLLAALWVAAAAAGGGTVSSPESECITGHVVSEGN
jgi:hypothetical protein